MLNRKLICLFLLKSKRKKKEKKLFFTKINVKKYLRNPEMNHLTRLLPQEIFTISSR